MNNPISNEPPPNFIDKTPYNWIIEDIGDGKILAKNSKTGEMFSGTPKEFSAKLRGINVG